jgi:hypothetical protein
VDGGGERPINSLGPHLKPGKARHMARRIIEPEQTIDLAEATMDQAVTSPEPRREQATDAVESRRGLKPGYVRLSLVVRQSTAIRLYAMKTRWKLSKNATAEKLLDTAMHVYVSDKRLKAGLEQNGGKDSDAA